MRRILNKQYCAPATSFLLVIPESANFQALADPPRRKQKIQSRRKAQEIKSLNPVPTSTFGLFAFYLD